VKTMKKKLKEFRLKLKHFYHQTLLKHHDFSIISNNCWGTRTYQKYGLPYASPFQSLFIFAPDYMRLMRDFSIDKLQISHFIEHENSKYKTQLIAQNLFETSYPIGILHNDIELHFLHYKTPEDAQDKWNRRVKRINANKLIFKFSDGNLSTETLIREFDALEHKNKICFTSKPYAGCKNVIYMSRFKNNDAVDLEWKYDSKYCNIHKFINSIKVKSHSKH